MYHGVRVKGRRLALAVLLLTQITNQDKAKTTQWGERRQSKETAQTARLFYEGEDLSLSHMIVRA